MSAQHAFAIMALLVAAVMALTVGGMFGCSLAGMLLGTGLSIARDHD